MEEQKICQSCGLKLIAPVDFGTNQDGSINEEYCRSCYLLGQFTEQNLPREMMEQKIAQRIMTEKNLPAEKVLEEAKIILNHLGRWGLPNFKTIIYYFSKTGNCRLVGEIIKKLLNAELEEIKEIEPINVLGFANHFKHGRLSFFGKIVATENIKNSPTDYQLICLISPVWGFSIPYPVRSFIKISLQNEETNKIKLLLILTHEGQGFKRTFKQLRKILKDYDLLGELAIQSAAANPAETEKIIKSFLTQSLR